MNTKTCRHCHQIFTGNGGVCQDCIDEARREQIRLEEKLNKMTVVRPQRQIKWRTIERV